MSLVASAPFVLLLAGVLVGVGRAGVSWPKVSIALLALGVEAVLLARLWTSVPPDGSRAGAPLGSDPLSVFSTFALVLALALATLALARRGSAEALSSTFLASAALGLALASSDWVWFFAALAMTRAIVGLSDAASSSAKPDGSRSTSLSVLSVGAWLALAALAVVLLSVGASTSLVRLAELGSAPSGVSALGVGAAVLAVLIAWLDLNAAAWRLPYGLAACATISLGASLAACAMLVRATSWLAELSLLRPATWMLVALGAVGAMAGGLGALLARERRGFLSRLAVAHAGLAAMSIPSGVSGRVFGLLVLAASHAALLGASLAWELQASDEECDVVSIPPRPGAAVTLLFVASLGSLATLPPLPVFVSKLGALAALVSEGRWPSVSLALVSSALVSVACLRVAAERSSRTPRGPTPPAGLSRAWAGLAASLALAMTLGLGVLPDVVIELAAVAVAGFF